MDAPGDLHIQALLDRLEQIHDHCVTGVEPAEPESIAEAVPVEPAAASDDAFRTLARELEAERRSRVTA